MATVIWTLVALVPTVLIGVLGEVRFGRTFVYHPKSARAAIVDPVTALLAVTTFAVLVRFKVNSAWLVAAGGVLGVVARLLSQ